MKILTLSDLKETGGASIAKNRISSCLKDLGHDIVTASSDGLWSGDHSVLSLGKRFDLLTLFFKNYPQLFRNLRNFGLCKQLRLLLNTQQPDVVHIHNLHSTSWPLTLVSTALQFTSVIWTLHDCYSFSGSFCPSHTPSPQKNFLREITSFWDDHSNLKNSNFLMGVAPSNWLLSEACKAHWNEDKITKIHNPIPDSYFNKRNRVGCKKALGLNCDKPTILLISGNLNAKHKGGWMIENIIQAVPPNEAEFLIVGDGCPNFSTTSNIRQLGCIKDEITIQLAYNAADLLVHPAPIDNLPNTVAESMSCGTPVLAFKTGGVPEMVAEGISGWLVNKISEDLFVENLLSILKFRKYKDIRYSVQQHARKLFDSNLIANQYHKILGGSLIN